MAVCTVCTVHISFTNLLTLFLFFSLGPVVSQGSLHSGSFYVFMETIYK